MRQRPKKLPGMPIIMPGVGPGRVLNGKSLAPQVTPAEMQIMNLKMIFRKAHSGLPPNEPMPAFPRGFCYPVWMKKGWGIIMVGQSQWNG